MGGGLARLPPGNASRRPRSPASAIPLIAALGHTLRWRTSGLHHFDAIRAAGHQPVMAFWHGRILTATFYFRRRGIVVITSENFDGEWIARIIERFGYGTARGSTSSGGKRALLQLVRDMKAGKPAGLHARRSARSGARGAAGRGVAGDGHRQPAAAVPPRGRRRRWTARSWDRTQVPKPFSTVGLAVGEPLYVAAGASEAQREAVRVELERRLAALEGEAARLSSSR